MSRLITPLLFFLIYSSFFEHTLLSCLVLRHAVFAHIRKWQQTDGNSGGKYNLDYYKHWACGRSRLIYRSEIYTGLA